MDDVKQTVLVTTDGAYMGSNLPVTRADFEALSEQRRLLQEYTSRELRREIDYGVIPGTHKPSLFKPGAEKLARLFGLSGTFTLMDKIIDADRNFAMFTYKVTLTHMKTGQVVAECEASCNSQEKKYRERKAWVDKKQVIEATPIYDILNTLQKMSQKRAFVGAVILGVAASDFFTQDLDDVDDARSVGAAPDIRDVGSHVPNVTKVTSEPKQHADGSATFLAQALTSIDERQMPKDAGFRWDKDSKMWTKRITESEAAALPFKTRRLA